MSEWGRDRRTEPGRPGARPDPFGADEPGYQRVVRGGSIEAPALEALARDHAAHGRVDPARGFRVVVLRRR